MNIQFLSEDLTSWVDWLILCVLREDIFILIVQKMEDFLVNWSLLFFGKRTNSQQIHSKTKILAGSYSSGRKDRNITTGKLCTFPKYYEVTTGKPFTFQKDGQVTRGKLVTYPKYCQVTTEILRTFLKEYYFPVMIFLSKGSESQVNTFFHFQNKEVR